MRRATKKLGAEPGFEAAQIAAFLRENADKLEKAKLPERAGFATGALAREEAGSLREMAEAIETHRETSAAGRSGAATDSAGGKALRGVDGGDSG